MGRSKQNMNPIVSNLVENYQWLLANNLYHPDVVLDQLASPELSINNDKFVSFSSNNYLGLSNRPEIINAAKEALIKFSNSTSESRKLGGNLRILEQLEDKLSEFKGSEDTMIFATGLLANVGVISAITDISNYMELFYGKKAPEVETVILGDQLNHRSIQMGVKLSRATHVKYKHNDMVDLENKLIENKDANKIIITDGVFSMDGDLAPLDVITSLAETYNAAVMIDDAHGSGVFGENGRGSAEHFHVSKKIDFQMGTLSKAFGGLGGFVSAKKEVIDMLKVNTSTYYFTSSLPADQAAGLIKAVEIAMNEPQLRVKLWNNVYRMIKGLFDMGFDSPLRFSQIIPVMIYDEKKAYKVEEFLQSKGILCSAVTVPAVAPGKSRLRISINASHSDKHIDQLLNALAEAKKIYDIPQVKRTEGEWKAFMKESPEYILKMLGDKKI